MRIFNFIFKSAVFLVIVGGLGFLLLREVLLFMGASKIKSSLSVLRSAAVQESYFEKCKEKGAVFANGDNPVSLQLRFISSNEYRVEVLCSQFSIDPIVISQEQLPMFVNKVAGRSGITWGDDRSAVTLEVFNRRRSIGVENRLTEVFPSSADLGVGPITSCEGYGFSCCETESEQGVGQLFANSADCPKSCFSECESRPVLLAFNTQPFLDLKNRTVAVSPGESVSFSYVVDPGAAGLGKITLDYGDGQRAEFDLDRQTVDHVYRCSRPECRYEVKIFAVDGKGILSADLAISRITIIVKGS